MKSHSELRAAAREQLKGNWGKAILAFLIFAIISWLPSTLRALGTIITLFIMGPLQYGITQFYLKLSRREQSDIEAIFDGFRIYKKTLILGLLIWVFLLLWSLPAIIPGTIIAISFIKSLGIYQISTGFRFEPIMWVYILCYLLLSIPSLIAVLRYSQAYFVVLDNPGIGALDAIKLSKTIMKGHKGRLFVLYLTFIGWAILAVIPLGLGLLLLMPYVKTTLANFYNDLKAANAAVEPVVTPENV